jgi:hypothetical protein
MFEPPRANLCGAARASGSGSKHWFALAPYRDAVAGKAGPLALPASLAEMNATSCSACASGVQRYQRVSDEPVRGCREVSRDANGTVRSLVGDCRHGAVGRKQPPALSTALAVALSNAKGPGSSAARTLPGAKRKPLGLLSATVNRNDGGSPATIRHPNRDRDEAIPTDELLRRFGGILLLLERPKQP